MKNEEYEPDKIDMMSESQLREELRKAVQEICALRSQAGAVPDIGAMVDRFLCWRLPADFSPDCGISFKPIDHPSCWPIGTNLLNAAQAKAMLEHLLAAPPSPAADERSNLSLRSSLLLAKGEANRLKEENEKLADACDIGLRYVEAMAFNTPNPKKRKNYSEAAEAIRAALAARKADGSVSITDSRCNYLAPGACNKCGNVHDGGTPPYLANRKADGNGGEG